MSFMYQSMIVASMLLAIVSSAALGELSASEHKLTRRASSKTNTTGQPNAAITMLLNGNTPPMSLLRDPDVCPGCSAPSSRWLSLHWDVDWLSRVYCSNGTKLNDVQTDVNAMLQAACFAANYVSAPGWFIPCLCACEASPNCNFVTPNGFSNPATCTLYSTCTAVAGGTASGLTYTRAPSQCSACSAPTQYQFQGVQESTRCSAGTLLESITVEDAAALAAGACYPFSLLMTFFEENSHPVCECACDKSPNCQFAYTDNTVVPPVCRLYSACTSFAAGVRGNRISQKVPLTEADILCGTCGAPSTTYPFVRTIVPLTANNICTAGTLIDDPVIDATALLKASCYGSYYSRGQVNTPCHCACDASPNCNFAETDNYAVPAVCRLYKTCTALALAPAGQAIWQKPASG